MKSIVNNELGYTELIIEEEVRYQEDYQMRMLKECQLEGLVSVVGCGVDELSQYIYDVSGMQNIKNIYERECINENLIKDMCTELLEVFDRVKGHMLDINKILLSPEYIFKNSSGYHFCYYPSNTEWAQEKFHQLTEYFVKAIDYNDMNSVRLVCGLHKSTMEEQYDLQEVLLSYSNMTFDDNLIHQDEENDYGGKIYSNEEEVEINVVALELGDAGMDDSQCTQYKQDTNSQVSPLLRETAIGKWWGNRRNPLAEKKQKIKRIEKDKWGDWDALIKEDLP